MAHSIACRLAAAAVLAATACWGQSTLSLSSGSADTNGNATLNLTLSAPTGGEPAGLQFALTYSPSEIVSIVSAAGASAKAADKSIKCALGSGSYFCLLAGVNSKVMQNGVVAVVSVKLATGVAATTINVTKTLGANTKGTGLPVNGTGASVTAAGFSAAAVASLACAPSNLQSRAVSTCTITVSKGDGAVVKLSGGGPMLTIPGSVTIGPGATTATFAATAGAVTSSQTAAITASLNGTSQTAVIGLVAP